MFPVMGIHMRWFTAVALLVGFAVSASAHHPDRENKPVHPRIDLIGPLGNRLPMSYRRKYNRPTYLGGKIAYWIAPSSQEAMAWHEATHLRAYADHRPRIEKHYFYPKPWEALQIGPRVATGQAASSPSLQDELYEASEYDLQESDSNLQSVPVEPMMINGALIE